MVNSFTKVPQKNIKTTVGGKIMEAKQVKINEWKAVSGLDVRTILVKTKNINIDFIPTFGGDIEVRFYGDVTTIGTPRLQVEMDGNICYITAEIVGGSWKGKPQVDIQIPPVVFDLISAQSDFANITMDWPVGAECIDVKVKNGNIKICADYSKAALSNQFGDISVVGYIARNTRIDISNDNGDIYLGLENIKKVEFTSDCQNGKVGGEFTKGGEFEARINVRAKNGDITIQ